MSDVLVIGAGVIGASIGFHLAEAGAKVTVIDQARPAGAASGKSFGWINASFAESRAYFDLRNAAIPEHHVLAARLDVGQSTQWNGCIWWEDEGDAFDAHVAELVDHGYSHRLIDRAEIARLEPQLQNLPERAVLTEAEGAADGAELTQALLTGVLARGGKLHENCAVSGFTAQNGRIKGVNTPQGDLYADQIVLAVGAETDALLAQAGLSLPMDNKIGVILHTSPTKPLINHIIMSTDVHFRQAPQGHFVMGEIFSGGGLDVALGEDARRFAAKMLARLHARLPAASHVEIADIKMGLRPVPTDGFPAIGAFGGLYVATMHSGITLAPLIGKMAAQEILHGHSDTMLAPFRPDRF